MTPMQGKASVVGIHKDLLRRSCLLIVALLLGLLAADGALWIFAPIETDAEVYKVRQSVPGTKSEFVIKTYRYGIRARTEPAVRKPARTLRVLCLGASTTEALSQDSEDAWWGILEKMVIPHLSGPALDIQFLAVGKGGYTVFEDLQWVTRNLQEIDPDIVITLMGINNLAWKGEPGYAYSSNEQMKRLEQNDASWKTALEKRSQLVRRMIRVKRRLAQWRNLDSGRAIDWRDVESSVKTYRSLPYSARPVRDPDPVVEFEDGVNLLMAHFSKRGIREVIALGQPVLWKDHPSKEETDRYWFSVSTGAGRVRADPQWLAKEMRRYNAVQEKAATRYGFTYLDLAGPVPSSTAVFFDDCHLTDEGNRVLAAAVLPAVLEAVNRIVARGYPSRR